MFIINSKLKLIVVYLIIILAGFVFVGKTQLHTDILYFLYVFKSIIVNNLRLSVDIFDVNTPITYLFNLPVVLLNLKLGMPLEVTFKIYSLILVLTVYFGFYRTLFRDLKIIIWDNKSEEFTGVVFLTLVLFTGQDFMQRDFWGVYLTIPFIFLSYRNLILDRKPYFWEIIFVVLLGTVGLGFKPVYIIMVLFCEVYFLIMTSGRSLLRRELWILAGVGIVELVAMYVFYPGLLQEFWLGTRYYHGFVSRGVWVNWEMWFGIVLFLYLFLKSVLNKKYKFNLFLSILILSLLSTAYLQGKGFWHHFWGIRIILGISAVRIIYSLKGNWKKISIKLFLSKLILILILYLISVVWLFQWIVAMQPLLSVSSEVYVQNVEYFKLKLNYNERFAVVSTVLYPFSLLEEYTGALNVMRYRNLWMLPGMYFGTDSDIYRNVNQMNVDELGVYESVIGDLINKEPKIIVIDNCNQKSGWVNRSFDYYKYFGQSKEFDLLLLTLYTKDTSVYGCYDVWERRLL